MSNIKQEPSSAGMIPQHHGMIPPQGLQSVTAMMGHQPMMMPGMMQSMIAAKQHQPAGMMVGSSSNKNAKASSYGARFKKAPDAPKRFKSAFIIFSAEKHKEIKEQYASEGRTEKTTDIAKIVSQAWREMDSKEREIWDEKARQDKARYEMERSLYKGPWKIPANKRTPKDPSAPKRPMSAFLAFSNKRRAGLKRENPDATNADLSKMLSKQWKEIDPNLKRQYMEEEAGLRAQYKVEMAKWRKRVAEEKKAERKEREAIAIQAAETRQGDGGSTGQQQVQATPDMASAQAMNGFTNPAMYGYGMPGGAGAGAPTDFSGASMQGVSGFNPALMGNPFAAQPFMGNAATLQQFLAQQQLFQQQGQMGQRGMGMFGQGMPGMLAGQPQDNSGGQAPAFFQGASGGDMSQQQQMQAQMNMMDPQMNMSHGHADQDS